MVGIGVCLGADACAMHGGGGRRHASGLAGTVHNARWQWFDSGKRIGQNCMWSVMNGYSARPSLLLSLGFDQANLEIFFHKRELV
jgi:hypothetical protein